MHPHCIEFGHALLLRGHCASRLCARPTSGRRQEYLLGEEAQQEGEAKVFAWRGTLDVAWREGHSCCQYEMYEVQDYATRGK